MQPVNVEDVGNAYFKVLQNRNSTFGKQYNLSGKDQLTYISILKEISSALGKKVFADKARSDAEKNKGLPGILSVDISKILK